MTAEQRKGEPNSEAERQPFDIRNGKFPALCGYLDRIGAEQRNFRRFVVKREGKHHYHYDAAIIRIKGMEVESSDDQYAPTAEEAKGIASELAAPSWPHSVPFRDTHPLRQKLRAGGTDPVLFEFHDPQSGYLSFAQQRIRDALGGKIDLPWTFWSDGQFRCMEPDGDLPLYGLEQLASERVVSTVFLHEGAATAHRVMEMDYENHPWVADLTQYGAVHLGWPGGAPNPHRVDWDPIRKLSPGTEIIVVCDNDMGGEEAGALISRLLKRRLRVLRFGKAFPPHFDLADPFPPEMWREEKEGDEVRRLYTGPSFETCVGPATWATRQVGKGYALRDEFVAEWLYSVKPEVFMLRDRLHRRWSADEFNNLVAPYSDIPNVANLLRKHPSVQAETLVYEPGENSGRIAFDGHLVINVYEPSAVEPKDGEVRPFLDFMEQLVPDPAEATELLKWCATLIARPDIHMTYSVLLISQTQGVGKSTLAEKILAPLVGWQNCSVPSANMIANSEFTSWMAFKRLAIVAELYEGHTSKTYNRLKTIITDDNIEVNEKYEKSYRIKNHIHIVASSNDFRALKIDDGDRRWLVPGVTERKRSHDYWKHFHRWLGHDGLGIIARWAREYVEEHGYVLPGVEAPQSEAKRRGSESGHE